MLPQVKLNDFIHAVSIPDTVESIPRFSKSIFRTKSRFPWIYLVLPMIFRTLDFWKFRTGFYEQILLPFKNLHSISRT